MFFQIVANRLSKLQNVMFRNKDIIIIIIIIIIFIIIVSFMHGIQTHIPKSNHVPRGYIVAAILSLLCMVPLSIFRALAHYYYYYYYYY
jgi:phosphatidylserine synthase